MSSILSKIKVSKLSFNSKIERDKYYFFKIKIFVTFSKSE